MNEQLKEFLNNQKAFSSDAKRWEFIYKSAYAWERKCSVDLDRMMMPRFFNQWYISAHWGEFSLPESNPYTLEETLHWIFVTGLVLINGYGKKYVKEKWVPYMPTPPALDWLIQRTYQYSQETCTWLDKQRFLAEMENIYNRSQEVLQEDKRLPGINPEWICDAESGCSKFFKYYTFCKDCLKNPEIVRLNKFEPNENVWYLIREESTLYFLWLRDFF